MQYMNLMESFKRTALAFVLMALYAGVASADNAPGKPQVAEAGVVASTAPVQVTVSSTAWVCVPSTTSYMNGRTGMAILNEAANSADMVGRLTNDKTAPSSSQTYGPFEYAPGKTGIAGVSDKQFFWLRYVGPGASGTATVQEYKN